MFFGESQSVPNDSREPQSAAASFDYDDEVGCSKPQQLVRESRRQR